MGSSSVLWNITIICQLLRVLKKSFANRICVLSCIFNFDEQHQENNLLQCNCWYVPCCSTSNIRRKSNSICSKYVKPNNRQSNNFCNESNNFCNESNFHQSDLSRTEIYNVQDIRKTLEQIRTDIAEGKATEALQAIIDLDNKLLVVMSDNPPPMLEKSTGDNDDK